MSTVQLDEAALAAALASPHFLLFKHSHACGTSAAAFERYERFVAEHPEVPTGWVDVVAQRSLVRALAERTGVRHESPQALWLVDGKVVWNASHSGIHGTALLRATGGATAGPPAGR